MAPSGSICVNKIIWTFYQVALKRFQNLKGVHCEDTGVSLVPELPALGVALSFLL
jgi:hypothetical protein